MRTSEKRRREKRKEYNHAMRTKGYKPATPRKEWIQTFTGAEFFPLAPEENKIRLADIAHALALVCRFTGHVRSFYSVAEHSVRVSMLAEKYAERNAPTDKARALMVAKWGLIHDASEAYLADIASPIKSQPVFALYREAEKRLQTMIAVACGLPAEEPPEVKEADRIMCATEAHVLMTAHPAWAALGEPITPASPYAEIVADLGWQASFAEGRFLTRFEALAARTE